MLVREILKSITENKTLLLELAHSKHARTIAQSMLLRNEDRFQIYECARESAKQCAYMFAFTYGLCTSRPRSCLVPVFWLIASKRPNLIKHKWDEDVSIKPLTIKPVVEGTLEWLRGEGEQPKITFSIGADIDMWDKYIYSYVIESIINVCTQDVKRLNKDKESLEKVLGQCKDKLSDWSTKYSLLEIDNAQLRRDNQQLSEYVAALQTIPEPESIPVEISETRDLSGYRIKVCTTRQHMNLFEWDCFDVDAYPAAVDNCLKCDLVVIDTRHISHHTFWTVRDYCKSKGIKCVLVSYWNKERLRALAWEVLHR